MVRKARTQPIDGPEGERYDPRPSQLRLFEAGIGERRKTRSPRRAGTRHNDGKPVPKAVRQLSLPEPDMHAASTGGNLAGLAGKEQTGKRGVPGNRVALQPSPSARDGQGDPLVDQFCEQVARILARRKRTRKGAQ